MTAEYEAAPIRAPRNFASIRDAGSGAGNVSFGTYFMRDLWLKGAIDRDLIEELAKANQLDIPLDDVVAVLENSSGEEVPRALVAHVETLAELAAADN